MSRVMRRWPRLRRVLNGVLVFAFVLAMSSSAFGPAIAAAAEGSQDPPPVEEGDTGEEVVVPEEEVEPPPEEVAPPEEPPVEEPAVEPAEDPAEEIPGELIEDEAPAEEPAEETEAPEVPGETVEDEVVEEEAAAAAEAPAEAGATFEIPDPTDSTGNGIVPVYESGNPGCPVGTSTGDSGSWSTGTFNIPGITGGTITVSNATATTFDWNASGVKVKQVIVKAGNGALLYGYGGGAYSDTGLYSWYNNGGNIADISHVYFCYEDEEEGSGKVCGRKFYDAGRDGGGYDENEDRFLEGWTIELYRCVQVENGVGVTIDTPAELIADCQWELYETTTTNGRGFYCFDDLPCGKYYVVEQVPDGWTQSFGPTGPDDWFWLCATNPTGASAACEPPEVWRCFGNYRDVSKRWVLFFDNAPEGATFFVKYRVRYMGEVVDREVQLENVWEGKYRADVDVPFMSRIVGAQWYAMYCGQKIPLSGWQSMNELMDQDRRNPFCWNSMIDGYKFYDADRDGEWDDSDCEPGLEGWTIKLYRCCLEDDVNPTAETRVDCDWQLVGTTTTDENGYYRFRDLLPGNYVVVEELPDGWRAGPTGTRGAALITLRDKFDRVDFGNYHEDVTKSWILEYENAPEGTEFRVVYSREFCGESTRHEVALEPNGLENTYVGMDAEVPYGAVITAASWQMKAPGHDWIVLEVQHDLDEEMTTSRRNRFEYEGKLHGYKFEDLNGNGEWDDGEPALEGWTIKVDHYVANGIEEVAPSNSEPCTIGETMTDENGYFEFKDLPPGCYVVSEVLPEDWEQTAGPPVTGPMSFCIEPGGGEQEILFGNRRLLDKAFILTLSKDSPDDVSFYATYTLDGEETSTVLPGDNPFENGIVVPYGTEIGDVSWWASLTFGGATEEILLDTTPGELMSEDATNTLTFDPKVYGHKYHDEDGSGDQQTSESGLEGWTIKLFRSVDGQPVLHRTTTTDADGNYVFDDILPGTYYVLEEQEEGWTQTDGPTGDSAEWFDVVNGSAVEVVFGNQEDEEPSLPFTPPTAAPGGEPAPGAEPTTTTDQPYLPYTGGNLLLLLTGAGLAALGGTLLRRFSA